jgi:hypothetical protein
MSRPTLVIFRRPTPDSAEIVLSHKGETLTVPLTFDQVRLLAVEATECACMWPAKPAKAS